MVSKGRLLLAMTGCLLISAVAGCRAQAPAEPPEPVLNPNPKHVIRVHGRLPERFVTDWRIFYDTHNREDPACMVDSDWGPQPAKQMVPLELKRTGNKYEASLVVDRYVPDKCNWQLVVADATVGRSRHPEDNGFTDGVLIDGTRMHVPDDVPRCGSNAPRCTEERYWRLSNHDSTPVIVRCRLRASEENRSKQAEFGCQDPFNDSFKTAHLVRPSTAEIEVNFYDLDNETDPVAKNRTQEGASDE